MKNQEPRSSSSCAACKFLKRRCSPNCLFAPYFRSDEPNKFAKVHKVFGASNVSKILNEVPEEQREDTVNSLVYEAQVRLKDPVYGCIGAIASLQKKMVELQHDLLLAKARLATYYCANTTNPAATSTFLNIIDPISVDPHTDFPVSTGLELEEAFYQNSLVMGQNRWMNEFGQFPFL